MAEEKQRRNWEELERDCKAAVKNLILHTTKQLKNFQRLAANFGFSEEDILGDEGAVHTYVLQYFDTEREHGPKGPNGKCDWEAILKNLNEIFGHVYRMLSERIKTLPLDTIPLCFNNEIREAEEQAKREIEEAATIWETTAEALLQDHPSIIDKLPNRTNLQNVQVAQQLLIALLETPAIRKELDERISVYRKIEGDRSLGPEGKGLSGISLAETATALREKLKNVLD